MKKPPKTRKRFFTSKAWLESPASLREPVARLLKAGMLTEQEAGNVLSRDVPLEKVLVRKEVRRVMKQERQRSCLEDAAKAREPIALRLLRGKTLVGSISGVSPFQIAFEPARGNAAAGAVYMIDKVRLTHAYHPALEAAVGAARTVNAHVKAMGLAIPEKASERLRLRHEEIQRFLRNATRLKFLLFDGDLIQGTILWWSQYEIGVDVGKGVSVTLFRHALLGLSKAGGETVALWKGLAKRPAAPPRPSKASKPPKPSKPRTPSKPPRPEAADYDPTQDMTKAQSEIWRVIETCEGPWTVAQIVRKSGRSRGTVDQAVDLFLEAEMVVETPAKGRGRAFRVADGAD